MSKVYPFSIIMAVLLFLILAPVALAHTIQGDTGSGPEFLAQGDQGGDNQGDDGDDGDDGGDTGATGTGQQGQQDQMNQPGVQPQTGQQQGQQGQTGQQPQAGQQQGQTGQDNTLLPQTGEIAPSGSTSMLWVAGAFLALLALAGLSSFAGKRLV